LVKRMRRLQQFLFAEVGRHKVQTNWELLRIFATGQAQRRNAREVGRNGEDVIKIHLQRVGSLLAQLKRGRNRYGARDEIHLLESAIEILLDESAHLAGAMVVGFGVARGKRERAQNDPAFDLRTETRAYFLVEAHEIA